MGPIIIYISSRFLPDTLPLSTRLFYFLGVRSSRCCFSHAVWDHQHTTWQKSPRTHEEVFRISRCRRVREHVLLLLTPQSWKTSPVQNRDRGELHLQDHAKPLSLSLLPSSDLKSPIPASIQWLLTDPCLIPLMSQTSNISLFSVKSYLFCVSGLHSLTLC